MKYCPYMSEKLPHGRNMIINALVFPLEFDHVDQRKIKFDMVENDPQSQ
jgi:hypothetical protein